MLAAHEHHDQDGQTEVGCVQRTGHNRHQECLAQLGEHSAEVETLLQVLLGHGGLVAGAQVLHCLCLLGAGLKLLVVLALQPGQQGDHAVRGGLVEVRRGVGRMETGHSSAHDSGGEDRVQGDDAVGESGGVTLDTGDVITLRNFPAKNVSGFMPINIGRGSGVCPLWGTCSA